MPDSMRGEIDEDINTVAADQFSRLVVGKAGDISPMLSETLQSLGRGVRRGDVCIAISFDVLPVMMFKQRQHETSDWMAAEIRRNITNFQSSFRLGRIAMCGNAELEGLHVTLIPTPGFLIDCA